MKERGFEAIQVVVSVPSSRVATRIAKVLLEARLCACAQTLGPIRSHFHWQGKIDSAREWLLVLKARRTDFDDLQSEVVRQHPYDVPEILALPIIAGFEPYLDWLKRETQKPGTSAAGEREMSED